MAFVFLEPKHLQVPCALGLLLHVHVNCTYLDSRICLYALLPVAPAIAIAAAMAMAMAVAVAVAVEQHAS